MEARNVYGPISGGGGRNFKQSDTRPTTKAKPGEIVFHKSPQPNGNVGWISTTYGWLAFGSIQGVSSSPYTLRDGTQYTVRGEDGTSVPFLCTDLL